MPSPSLLRRLALPLLLCAFGPLPGRTLPTKPSHEQTELWRKQGRDLPVPETRQPALDPALPAYVPRRDLDLSGRFKGASSDVLTALTKQWIARLPRNIIRRSRSTCRRPTRAASAPSNSSRATCTS